MDLNYVKELYLKKSFWELNNQIMKDTEELCNTHPVLIDAIKYTVNNTEIIYDEAFIWCTPNPWNTKIIISDKRSFEAAKQYKWKKIAVLDFANNHSPWWAPHRAGAQEECLCRCSTLYPCLIWWDNYENYYQKHIDEYNQRIINNYGNNDVMYLPNIIVFKSDEDIPLILDEKEWYKVDIIVSAAPELYYGENYNEKKLEEMLYDRIERILVVAKQAGIQVLILWAYWCWAFHNPPKLVARIFKELLKDYNFETVEFPIFYRNDAWRNNYDTFLEIFNWWIKYDLERFKEAQKNTYKKALEEIRNWKKESHWMRYIFPQIAWLWYSKQSIKYWIQWIEEAKAYLENKELREHLLEITQAFLELEWNSPETILWNVDSLKMCSCMTLFKQAEPDIELFDMVLKKYYEWKQDSMTLEILKWVSEEEYPKRIESKWPEEYEWKYKEEFENLSKKRDDLLKKIGI